MKPKDWAIDVGVMVAAFLFGCMQLMLSSSSVVIPDMALRQYLGMVNVVPSVGAFVALAITVLPLVVRRKYSWPVFLFVMVAFLGLQGSISGLPLPIVGPVVALYTIASERSREEAAIAAGLAVLSLLFFSAPTRTASLAFFTRFQNIALIVAAAFAGYAYRTNRAYVAETEQRALEAERTREEEAARRVEGERVRIAREVHDITAHSLSAVSIQAAAAERLVDRDPEAAKVAIAAARTTAKDALEEIRSMIGVLRQGDGPAETEPTAGTERMSDLVPYLERAHVAATLDISGYDRSRVPAFVDVALFGIAREAATNIVRHAHAKNATLRLSIEQDTAVLVVKDDGLGALSSALNTPPAPQQTGDKRDLSAVTQPGGHGIAGMSERVSLLGGTLFAGALPQGGFRVEARIPLVVHDPRSESEGV